MNFYKENIEKKRIILIIKQLIYILVEFLTT